MSTTRDVSSFAVVSLGVLGIIATSLSSLHLQAAEKVCYVDEAAKDPSLVKFRTELLRVAQSRNVTKLRPLIAEDVYVEKDFSGREVFERNYRLSDRNSSYWQALENALKLGGRLLRPGLFCASYPNCPTPPPWGGQDKGVILGARVAAFEKPSTTSKVRQWLSCDVVRIPAEPTDPIAPPGWMPVELDASTWAFVQRRYVRATSDYYAQLELRNGHWLLTAFSAVD